MYCTKNTINNRYDEKTKVCTEVQTFSSSIVSLTTYKKDVDIHTKYYGLNIYDVNEVKIKIDRQKQYLETIFLMDKISNTKIPLKDLIISATHNPNRYYSQIQNRMNTLVSEANEKNLQPIFMTLTLPSQYHKMKIDKIKKQLIPNKRYNDITPREAVKDLTKMFSRLRHDRSLKELTKENRIYFRVNEPHKNGTPHTHILLFVPKENIERITNAFKRLFDTKSNDIQTNIKNATAYIMKYINKTLPLSKQKELTTKDRFLNAWYCKNRIIRFNSSRTLAPLSLYKLLYEKYTLKELTKLVKDKTLNIFVPIDNRQKIMEVFNGDELVYRRSENYSLKNSIDF